MKRLSAQTFRLSNPEASERSNFQTFPVPKLPSAQTFRLFLFRSFRALKLSDFSVLKLPNAQTFRLFRIRSFRALRRSDFSVLKLPSAQTFRFSSSYTSERSNFRIFTFLTSKFEFSDSGMFQLSYCQV